MQHWYFMALRKLMRERLHICNVDALIFLSFRGDHKFKCIMSSIVINLRHGLQCASFLWLLLVYGLEYPYTLFNILVYKKNKKNFEAWASNLSSMGKKTKYTFVLLVEKMNHSNEIKHFHLFSQYLLLILLLLKLNFVPQNRQ